MGSRKSTTKLVAFVIVVVVTLLITGNAIAVTQDAPMQSPVIKDHIEADYLPTYEDRHDFERIGVFSNSWSDEIQQPQRKFITHGVMDIVLGIMIAGIGILVLPGAYLIIRTKLSCFYWMGTTLIVIGLIILTSSPFIAYMYPEMRKTMFYMSEASILMLPVILYSLLQSLFGNGQHRIIDRIKFVKLCVAVVGVIWLMSSLVNNNLLGMYRQVAIGLLICSVVASILFFIVFLIYSLKEKNMEAVIFLCGYVLFGLLIIIDQFYYWELGSEYDLHLWRWGLLCLLGALALVQMKLFLRKYDQLLVYSKKLESLNNEFQQSEKLAMINQIAASVAHEIRNPIQVTRGFLQLLSSNSLTSKEVGYVKLAISELDRATEIITEFLNFAKPQYDKKTVLHINSELDQIKSIIYPLAIVHGHQIEMKLEPELFVFGSSSDFKQACINIIKNSIEAIKSDGMITIKAFKWTEKNKVIVIVEDNGEGMKESDLKRLGEPFYSKKSKGTGIGLNVTYRIIEGMQGELLFYSQLGEGTQVKIILPVAEGIKEPH